MKKNQILRLDLTFSLLFIFDVGGYDIIEGPKMLFPTNIGRESCARVCKTFATALMKALPFSSSALFVSPK